MAQDATTQGTEEVSTQFDHVAAFFKSLDKALKASLLYQAKGQLFDRMMNEVELKVAAATEKGEVTVKIASFGLVYQGKPLETGEEKRKPYLFRMFCDGIRELTIQRGVTRDELINLIAVLTSDPRVGEEDLVTMIWAKELVHIHLYVADTFSSMLEVSASGELVMSEKKRTRLDSDGSEVEALPLSSDDIRMLRPGENLVWTVESTTNVGPSSSLRDPVEHVRTAFQSMGDYGKFLTLAMQASNRAAAAGEELEASPLALGQFDALVARGQVEGVGEMLRLSQLAAERGGEGGKALHRALTTKERLKQLTILYEREYEALTPALKAAVSGAEEGMTALLSGLEDGPAQKALQEMLTSAGVDLTPFYSQRLTSEEEAVLLATIETLRRIGSDNAMTAISRTLSSTLTSVRAAALKAMQGRYTESARIGLGRALKDPSADNRLLALKILRDSGEPRVAWAIISTLEESNFESRDPSEQEAFYDALGAFHDDRTLGHFKEVMANKNLLRNKAVMRRQMLAVKTLGEMKSDHARELLTDLKKRWYLPGTIKQAIDAGLAKGGRG